ncbi:MAG: hypothetical protein V3S08_02600 [Phycisphaerales bacterium]
MWIPPSHRSLAVTALLLVSSPVIAGDAMWLNPVGGLFSDQLNWSTGVTPGPDDTVYFDLGNLYTVTFTADATNSFAYVLNDRITFDLGGFTYTLDDSSGTELIVGGDPTTGLAARLTVINGMLESPGVLLAPDPEMVAAVEVAGAGATWLASQIFIGMSGTASVDVFGGASMIVNGNGWLGYDAGAIGSLAVVGPGSTFSSGFVMVGRDGIGSVFITNGGVVEMNSGTRIAMNSGSSGSVFVDGAGSLWNVELTDVGRRGPGFINVSDGGTVISTANKMVLAREETGSAWITISGTGSSFDVGPSMRLSGEGHILVENGADISGRISIASRAGTQGALIVTGPTTTMNGGGFSVGGSGQAELTIADGATASNGQQATVGNNAVAIVTGAGTTWNPLHLRVLAPDAPGSLLIADNAFVQCFDGTLGDNSEVTITGRGSEWYIQADLVVAADIGEAILIIDGGATCESLDALVGDSAGSTGHILVDGPGSSFETLSDLTLGPSGDGTLSILGGAGVTVALVGGAYTQASTGHLVIELTLPSSVALQVYGSANLAGTLSVTLANGFDPAAGESFDIIDAFSISNTFDDLILSTTPSGRQLDVSYLSDRVRVTVALLDIPGDVDGDESVGIQDFLLLLAAWGPCAECTPASCPADINGDCVVGIDDLLLLLANWG